MNALEGKLEAMVTTKGLPHPNRGLSHPTRGMPHPHRQPVMYLQQQLLVSWP